mgnify:CR=1 FL=1
MKNNSTGNRHQRRATKRTLQRSAHKHRVPSDGIISDSVNTVPNSSSSTEIGAGSKLPWWKDARKVFHPEAFAAMKQRIKEKNAKFDRPESVNMERRRGVFRVKLINVPGRTRELLPDTPGRYYMLIPRSMARIFVSGVCQFVRISKSSDGSWAIVPADVGWTATTEVAHVRRRSWWFLRRYPYLIDMSGRVQPASMLYDYNIDPTRPSQEFYVTREYVKVRHQDAYNDYLRIHKTKPSDYGNNPQP